MIPSASAPLAAKATSSQPFGPRPPLDAAALATCLPHLPHMDWDLMRQARFLFVGTGAVGRPLAVNLAYLGMQRCVLVDPKPYKPQSRVSQCEPHEVGRDKSVVLAEILRRLGVDAAALVADIDDVPPGHVEPETVFIISADNRRAEISTGRLAAMMRERLVKVNVAPECLMASIRCYDLRGPKVPLCLECQMSETQYLQQRHPLSCDDSDQQATGSPRPLCQLAANAAALAVAQIVASPDHWAARWYGRQWQQMLLGGTGTMLQLNSNENCRWDHDRHWAKLRRLATGPRDTRLSDLLAMTTAADRRQVHLRFSARVTTRARCRKCQEDQHLVRWVQRLDQPVSLCRCGGPCDAVPFFASHDLPAGAFDAVWDLPLAAWGVPALTILAMEADGRQWSFVIGK